MIKKLLSIILLILSVESLAQQLSQSSQYMFNNFIINPAVAGSDEKVPVIGLVRRQWLGIKDAPVTQTVASHAYVGQNIGIGLSIYNDVTGPTRRTGINVSGARHIKLDEASDTWLSLGLGMLFFQYSFDPSKLTFDQPDDPAIVAASYNKFTPDFCSGAFLYSKDYYIGFSVQNMLQMKTNLFDITTLNDNNIRRNYFLTAGYDFVINDLYTISPSFLLKATYGVPMQADINAKLHIINRIWVGLSYRTSDAIIPMVGFNSNRIYLGYTYDIALNRLRMYQHGSHEIFVGFKLDNMLSKNGHHTRHYSQGHKRNKYKVPHHR